MTIVHYFASIGPGPYKFLGVETTEDRQMKNMERMGNGQVYTDNMCGGTCDHCGTAIWDVYFFATSEGKKFRVGSTCAEKAFGNSEARVINDFKRSKKKVDREKRHANEKRKISIAKELLDRLLPLLCTLPHPKGYTGKSAGESYAYRWEISGTDGKMRIYKELTELEKTIKNNPT